MKRVYDHLSAQSRWLMACSHIFSKDSGYLSVIKDNLIQSSEFEVCHNCNHTHHTKSPDLLHRLHSNKSTKIEIILIILI